jgi:hypothetical protein
MAYILAVLFRGFRRWDVEQHTAIWVAITLFRDTQTECRQFQVPVCQSAAGSLRTERMQVTLYISDTELKTVVSFRLRHH